MNSDSDLLTEKVLSRKELTEKFFESLVVTISSDD